MPYLNSFFFVRHPHRSRGSASTGRLARGAALVLPLLMALSLATGCGPSDGELASPPLLVSYGTGDMNDTIDGQMGLGEATTAEVTGGLGFEGESTMACGPTADDRAFRLRLTPGGGGPTTLTLRIPRAGHGGGHEDGHGGESGEDHGQGEELAADHGVGRADAPSVEQLTEEGRDGDDGTVEATAVLARVQDGRLVESTGTARVEIHPGTHAAGRHAVTGSFRAELEGEAGSASLEGSFEDCYYFTG